MKSNILKAMNNITIYGSNELLRFYVGIIELTIWEMR